MMTQSKWQKNGIRCLTCAHLPMIRSIGFLELSARAIRSLHKLFPMVLLIKLKEDKNTQTCY